MQIDGRKVIRMFDYLSAGDTSNSPNDGFFVFGRADSRIAYAAVQSFNKLGGKYCLFSGGIGKDSGFLTKWGVPESHYLASISEEWGMDPQIIRIEDTATNGAECCDRGLNLLLAEKLPLKNLSLVVHATSLRRVHALMQLKEKDRGLNVSHNLIPSGYEFNPNDPLDYKEAALEIIRLADWPAKNWCVAQPDLPQDLVEYARELKSNFENQ